MDAPSSAQTWPSARARIAPAIQPRTAWGPPIAATISGIVMNGPMPHIWVMFTAVAGSKPSVRWNRLAPSPVSAGAAVSGRASVMVAASSLRSTAVRPAVKHSRLPRRPQFMRAPHAYGAAPGTEEVGEAGEMGLGQAPGSGLGGRLRLLGEVGQVGQRAGAAERGLAVEAVQVELL